jgi:hypothetical protein
MVSTRVGLLHEKTTPCEDSHRVFLPLNSPFACQGDERIFIGASGDALNKRITGVCPMEFSELRPTNITDYRLGLNCTHERETRSKRPR